MQRVKPLVSLDTLRKLPKVELHSHLTASFPRSAFKVLLEEKGLDSDISYLDSTVVKEVFTTTFENIRKGITHKKDLEYISHHCFDAYYQDNVKYLEIRSTPKSMADIDSVEYVQTIIDSIKKFQADVNDEMQIR